MNIIITGTTGMIGEGVLLECLKHPQITKILSVSRKPCGIEHPKLTEYLVPDFLALQPNDPKLTGYHACFFCAGVSSVGMSEEQYERLTYDTTIAFARATGPNPQMSFVYVSGSGTDSSEKGRMHWARVKGKTENDLMKMPFKQAFGFRIGAVEPTSGQKRVLKYYKYFAWLIPVLKVLLPKTISSMSDVAHAMIHASRNGYPENVIQVSDIAILSKQKPSLPV